ncbi:MAG: sulfotransferase [Proteobacteria bacterium]|nr:sulfotransferase [Pseudomonadota bacterium]
MSDYSFFDRLLHRMALNPEMVRRSAFEIEARLCPFNSSEVVDMPHVLIAGLARSGTTVLLRQLYATGGFAAQTYRDMPFVLAPSLWRRVARLQQRTATATERIHGDGIFVDPDSVEAFEEVFWLTFAYPRYVARDHLAAHDLDATLCERFREFVALVIAARGGSLPYLSKNNNNVLRLDGLAKALPSAHIVIPFRDPLEHAGSLLNQHLRFSAMQSEDPFQLSYMRWLGHFEFGLDHRPFRFNGAQAPADWDAREATYWLARWIEAYQGILATAPRNAVFWGYDDFCADPASALSRLGARLGLGGQFGNVAPSTVHAGKSRTPNCDVPDDMLEKARSLHFALRQRAI